MSHSKTEFLLNRIKFFKYILLVIFCHICFNSLYAQNEQDYELVNIGFNGDIVFSETDLRNTIISQESPNWFSQFLYSFTSFGGEAIFYNPGFISTDLRRLQSFYKDRGYFKTKIRSEVIVDSTDNDTELIYHISPGESAYVKNYKLTGLQDLLPSYIENIHSRVTIDTTEIYSAEIVNETRSVILNFLGNRGYMDVTSRPPEILVDTVKNEVEITLDFNTGKRFVISDIRVTRSGEGKDEVNDQLLLDLVNIEPGEYFSNEKIRQSQIRLYRTNLFNSAIILPVREDTSGNNVPIEISANVGKIHKITPEIILNDEDDALNLGLALEYSRRNFLGGARRLSTAISVASTDPLKFIENIAEQDSLKGYFDARISLEQPQFFGAPINTVFESYLTSRKRNKEYDSFLYGASIRFKFELPRFTYVSSLSTYLNFEHEKNDYDSLFIFSRFFNELYAETDKTTEDSLAVVEEVISNMQKEDFRNSTTNNTLIGVNIGMNNTNDPQLIFPTSGVNLNLLLEAGNTFNPILSKLFKLDVDSPEYFKIQLISSVYFPFFERKKSAFAFKFKSGIIHTYSGNKFNIPLNQRFYSGGANSVRSYKPRELRSLRNAALNIIDFEKMTSKDFQQIFDQSIPPGGFFMLEFSSEARIHLFGDLGSAIFVDAGNIWDSPNEFNFKDVAVAAGFGFRYSTPFAPIRVDFAFKVWDPFTHKNIYLKEDSFKFQIGIGEAF